jgi:hypothetical protein
MASRAVASQVEPAVEPVLGVELTSFAPPSPDLRGRLFR